MGKIIGIDLGTSNSAAAVLEGGRPKIVPSAEGTTAAGKAFPSFVAFTKDGQMLVGEPARRQAVTNPEGTVMAAKRKMGTDYRYKIYGKEYSPQQISAFILQKIKRDAEAFLGDKVEKAVITVPAYFDDNQRQATKDAGTIAGLNVRRIINEPTAASLAYGIDKQNQSMKILVYDLGGGTLDVTVMEFDNGLFEVRSTSGDTKLGGTDMDEAVIKYIVDDFKKKENVDLSKDQKAYIRLKDAAEKAKIELSSTLETEINLPYITVVKNEPKHVQLTLSRSKFEDLISPIVGRSKQPLENAISEAKLSKAEIEKIILVGGPTRIPYVRKFVEDFFGKKVEGGVDPMECVATGAALQGAVLSGDIKDIVLVDVTPLTLGIETLGGITTPLINANTAIPVRKSKLFSTAADMQTVVPIHIVQGERTIAKDNVSLGQFNLEGIPPAPRGIPQIEVTFDIDSNGILTVSAKDKATNKEQKISIEARTKLTDEQIEKMKKEAEQFSEEDKKKKEQIEKMNMAENLAYTAEKTLNENSEKIDKADLEEARTLISKLRDAIKDLKEEDVDNYTKELGEMIQKIGSNLYSQNPEGTSENPGESSSETSEEENPGDTASEPESDETAGDSSETQ